MSMIDVVAAHALIDDGSGALVAHVRTPGEVETARISGAINAPLGQIDGQLTWLDGGTSAWLASGCPGTCGRARWPLDRQVRLTAGLLVAAAVAVTSWWPPARYLAGLIGAGLAVAAITNTCAPGLLLSRLPYKRRAQATRSATIAPGTAQTGATG